MSALELDTRTALDQQRDGLRLELLCALRRAEAVELRLPALGHPDVTDA